MSKDTSGAQKKLRHQTDGETEAQDLIFFDPIMYFDYFSDEEIEILAEGYGVSFDRMDLIIHWLNTQPAACFHHIDPEWREFVGDLQEAGMKVRFINDFLGTLPMTEVTFAESQRPLYTKILQGHDFEKYRFSGFTFS